MKSKKLYVQLSDPQKSQKNHKREELGDYLCESPQINCMRRQGDIGLSLITLTPCGRLHETDWQSVSPNLHRKDCDHKRPTIGSWPRVFRQQEMVTHVQSHAAANIRLGNPSPVL